MLFFWGGGTIFPHTVHKQHGTVNTSPSSLDTKMLKTKQYTFIC